MSTDEDKRRFDNDPNPWMPEQDRVRLAVMGKALEELSELICELSFKDVNQKDLTKEVADVRSQIWHVREVFELTEAVDAELSRLSITPVVAYDRDYDFSNAFASLSNMLARCIIQGVDEHEPVTGASNRAELVKRLAVAWRTTTEISWFYGLNGAEIDERVTYKYHYLARWLRQLREMA